MGRRTGSHGGLAVVLGEQPPAMSVSFADDFFVVFYSDYRPGLDDKDSMPGQPICLHCLLDEGDEQLGRGLDMAKRHGHVDYDVEAGEWFVPTDAGWAKPA